MYSNSIWFCCWKCSHVTDIAKNKNTQCFNGAHKTSLFIQKIKLCHRKTFKLIEIGVKLNRTVRIVFNFAHLNSLRKWIYSINCIWKSSNMSQRMTISNNLSAWKRYQMNMNSFKNSNDDMSSESFSLHYELYFI